MGPKTLVKKEGFENPYHRNREISHYKGCTIIVMENIDEGDFNYVSKQGIFPTEEDFSNADELLSIGYGTCIETREEARFFARKEIDAREWS